MKKILLLAILAISFVSCSGGLESKAKKQMKKTMLEIAKNPESIKIDNIKTIINNDSLCVLSFNARGQNGFGGYDRSNYEYYYVKSVRGGEVEFMEALNEISKGENGIIDECRCIIEELEDNPDFSDNAVLYEKAYHFAKLMCIGSKHGRKIK